MRVFNKKLNRLLAIMLASVMGATSLPATQVSADTPSSEYDISNDAASDDISDSKIPDEQDSDNNATEEKQPQQLTVEYTPADDIYDAASCPWSNTYRPSRKSALYNRRHHFLLG